MCVCLYVCVCMCVCVCVCVSMCMSLVQTQLTICIMFSYLQYSNDYKKGTKICIAKNKTLIIIQILRKIFYWAFRCYL